MTALTSLHVDIAYCKELTSIEEFGKGLGNCTKITNLYLDLGYLVEEKEQERGRGNPPPPKLLSGVPELSNSLTALTQLERMQIDLEELKEPDVTMVGQALAMIKDVIPECAVDFRGCGIQWRGPCAMAPDIVTGVANAVARAASRRKPKKKKK
jgi:hypothetical protein